MTPKEVVRAFWAAMASNDFAAAGAWLGDDYELYWPQSGERVLGRADFAALNAAYPAAGPWRFRVHRLVAEGDRVVSDVGVTDGRLRARVITFSTVRGARIAEQVEFWPERFEPAAWRAAWVRRADDAPLDEA